MPTCLVPLTDGSEELEAISIWNPLRRAGVEVTVASIKPDSLEVTCARGTVIKFMICGCVDSGMFLDVNTLFRGRENM